MTSNKACARAPNPTFLSPSYCCQSSGVTVSTSPPLGVVLSFSRNKWRLKPPVLTMFRLCCFCDFLDCMAWKKHIQVGFSAVQISEMSNAMFSWLEIRWIGANSVPRFVENVNWSAVVGTHEIKLSTKTQHLRATHGLWEFFPDMQFLTKSLLDFWWWLSSFFGSTVAHRLWQGVAAAQELHAMKSFEIKFYSIKHQEIPSHVWSKEQKCPAFAWCTSHWLSRFRWWRYCKE